MGKNNSFSNKNPCNGCGACYSVCPVSAIKFEINQNGFYEAFVDEDKCISCGKCVFVCPKYIGEEKQIDRNNFPAYSFVYNDEEILKGSSSGAVSWALIEIALSKDYKVVGVEYDYISNTAKTFVYKDLKQAQKSKGSKYVQSDTRIYKEILKEQGKFIVFGTPCQLAGLAKAADMLKRRADFLLVDCFCHGVPSYLLWHKFLKHIGIEQPKEVCFRSKKGGWHNFYMEISDLNNKYCADVQTNPFYKLFFSDLLLNESCYSCKAKSATFSDIRIGDFWGSDYDLNEQGVSVVLPLSDSGKEWVALLKTKGKLKDISSLRNKIIKSQSAFFKTSCLAVFREQLLLTLKQSNFAQVITQYHNSLSFKKKLVVKLKSLLPSYLIKYVRYIMHRKHGY